MSDQVRDHLDKFWERVDEVRELILAITYIIVVFSIIVQELTIGKLVKASKKK